MIGIGLMAVGNLASKDRFCRQIRCFRRLARNVHILPRNGILTATSRPPKGDTDEYATE
jgi:hypothetical protein